MHIANIAKYFLKQTTKSITTLADYLIYYLDQSGMVFLIIRTMWELTISYRLN